MHKAVLFSALIVVMACSSTKDEGGTNDSTLKDSVVRNDVSVDKNSSLASGSQEKGATNVSSGNISEISDLPAKWELLTVKGSQLIIKEYCDAENATVSISKSEAGDDVITHGMGQMAEQYKVLSFQRTSPGNFLIKGEGTSGEGIKFAKVRFTNRDKGLAEWSWVSTPDEVSTGKELFVIAENASDYPVEEAGDCEH